MADPFARLGALMVRFRWATVVVWLVLLLGAGGLLAPRTASALKGGGFIDTDSDSARAAALLDTEFNASTFSNAVVVFRSSSVTVDDPLFKADVARAADN